MHHESGGTFYYYTLCGLCVADFRDPQGYRPLQSIEPTADDSTVSFVEPLQPYLGPMSLQAMHIEQDASISALVCMEEAAAADKKMRESTEDASQGHLVRQETQELVGAQMAFWYQLHMHLELTSNRIGNWPTICYRPLDLSKLWTLVQQAGGYDAVCNNKSCTFSDNETKSAQWSQGSVG